MRIAGIQRMEKIDSPGLDEVEETEERGDRGERRRQRREETEERGDRGEKRQRIRPLQKIHVLCTRKYREQRICPLLTVLIILH
jgi:hypothetical protein